MAQVDYTIFDGVTLTDDYTDNTTATGIPIKNMADVALSFEYAPKAGETGRYAELIIETSTKDDDNYRPQAIMQTTATGIKVYCDQSIKIPGGEDGAGGTAYDGVLPITLVGDKVKFKIKENGSADFGTASLKLIVPQDLKFLG